MQPVLGRHRLHFVGQRNHTAIADRQLRRGPALGTAVKVFRGVFVDAAFWNGLGPDDRRRLRSTAAIEAADAELVLSHRSAASMLGVPLVGAAPDEPVDVLTTFANGTRTEHGFRRHATRVPRLHTQVVDGLLLTSPARTVVDLALSEPFGNAVVAMDWALRNGVTRDEVRQVLDDLALPRGSGRAKRVIAFADPRSESAGESLSRVVIHELGLPAPELQVAHRDGWGLAGIADFTWPSAMLIGEFDGRVKYADEAMLAGRSATDVVIAEKRREDRLRALGFVVVRWMWSDVRTAGRLGAILTAAGLTPVHRSRLA